MTDPPKETPVRIDRWYGGKGVHVFMATSLRWEVPDACFHEFAQNETVTNEVFLNAMKKRNGFFNWMHRRPGATVVLDNAPGHGEARRIGKLENIKIIDWPSKSPDLNLIENLWSMMDKYIHSHLRPHNRKELQAAIPKAKEYLLNECHEAYVNTLKSLPTRLAILREREGGNTGY